ncbi:MAG: valine--tRNA ligase [Patescibacteria group bacterium]|nr:valine--tRNA ligase [Patescibacteria group bacterium]
MDKAYEPKKYEDDIYKSWEESGFFNPDVCIEKGITTKDSKPFTIVLPPPNVTGTLHMGHAAMLAIEDVMVRYHRMKGDKTLWVPGTDHAAVATESKVEKMLIESGEFKKPKEELGREKFLERVAQFAQESHDTIVNQSKKMGSSLDWSREAFTLDEKRNLAVKTVFKKMYDDGLIYRGYRVINWSVKGQSTCSDDELVHIERPAKMYYFKYSKDFPITIATTRPETKLGDTAVAVNPTGKYQKYIGQEFEVQDVGQKGHILKIKIIGDDHVDESFGTGALGVTPAHSPVDFEMYLKQKALGNDIGLIQVIGEDGKMTDNAGSDYSGFSVEEAREKFVNYLSVEGLLEKEEDIMQNVGTSDRFKDVVEPLPKTQWFIDVNKKFQIDETNFLVGLQLTNVKNGEEYSLKELMQKVVTTGQIKIVPERFDKVYFNWIDNLRDWCISRQIWYGHQIPVWYRKGNGERGTGNGEIHVGVEAPEGEGWAQDPDTLDTWFSAGLWTFSALGWPEKTADLQNFHPTSVLETGYDILFFWVARMILMTTYTLGQVPFETVYLHGLVRDEQGRKMSKSLGNIINPLDMIEKYGTDATRLSLLLGNTPGSDMKLSEEKIGGFRNFANKLWNMARFIEMTLEAEEKKLVKDINLPEAKTLSDKWILQKLNEVSNVVVSNLDSMNLSYAGEKLRDFTWNDLADWYLEIAKIEGEKSEILNYALNTVLKLWHPFMPFVTEAIWQEFYGKENILMVEKFPLSTEQNLEIKDFEIIQNVIVGIRSIKGDYKIDPVKKLNVTISAGDKKDLLSQNSAIISKLARLENLHIEEKIAKPDQSVSFVESGLEIFVELAGVVDFAKEKEKLGKEIEQLTKYIAGLEGKLSNSGFVSSAPASIIEQETNKLSEAKEKLEKLNKQFSNI